MCDRARRSRYLASSGVRWARPRRLNVSTAEETIGCIFEPRSSQPLIGNMRCQLKKTMVALLLYSLGKLSFFCLITTSDYILLWLIAVRCRIARFGSRTTALLAGSANSAAWKWRPGITVNLKFLGALRCLAVISEAVTPLWPLSAARARRGRPSTLFASFARCWLRKKANRPIGGLINYALIPAHASPTCLAPHIYRYASCVWSSAHFGAPLFF